jgi:hypothetical protein
MFTSLSSIDVPNRTVLYGDPVQHNDCSQKILPWTKPCSFDITSIYFNSNIHVQRIIGDVIISSHELEHPLFCQAPTVRNFKKCLTVIVKLLNARRWLSAVNDVSYACLYY